MCTIPDLAVSDDGYLVSTRADYCLTQRDAWLAIAAKCARTIGKDRGYRLAVSRAGTWARRAQRAYRDEVTRSQRIALYTSEVLDTRADVASFNAAWKDAPCFGCGRVSTCACVLEPDAWIPDFVVIGDAMAAK